MGCRLHDEDLLVIIDVILLYTNIIHDEGIHAINKSLEEAQVNPLLRMFIFTLIKKVLTKNHFEFNSQLYIQKMGTAMGTRMVPSYANLFMKHLEHELLDRSPKKSKI